MKKVKRFMIMIMTIGLLQSRLRVVTGFNHPVSGYLLTACPETAEKYLDMKRFKAFLQVIYNVTKTIFLVLAILAFYIVLIINLVY